MIQPSSTMQPPFMTGRSLAAGLAVQTRGPHHVITHPQVGCFAGLAGSSEAGCCTGTPPACACSLAGEPPRPMPPSLGSSSAAVLTPSHTQTELKPTCIIGNFDGWHRNAHTSGHGLHACCIGVNYHFRTLLTCSLVSCLQSLI